LIFAYVGAWEEKVRKLLDIQSGKFFSIKEKLGCRYQRHDVLLHGGLWPEQHL
jgi:hypothetical protein